MRRVDKNHLTLLGDFGTGKSSFALWLTYVLAKRRLTLGVAIITSWSLRDHVGKVDIAEIITNVLVNTYSLRKANYACFQKLLESGQILVVLDGFDETATLSDPEALGSYVTSICWSVRNLRSS